MPGPAPSANRPSDHDLAILLAKQEITEILYRYCRGTDRGDADLLRSCFHPDSTHVMGKFSGRSHEYIDTRILALGSTLDHCIHFITNLMIEVEGDLAVSESLFLARHVWTDPKTKALRTRVVEGRYLDRFERRAGLWRIAHRSGLMPFIQESDLPGPVVHPMLEMSGRYPNDPIYALLAGLRAKAER